MVKPNEKPVNVGDAVHLVTARGEHLPAKVTAVRSLNLIDLVYGPPDKPIAITSSPLDVNGKQPDSWHLPEPAPATPAAATPAAEPPGLPGKPKE